MEETKMQQHVKVSGFDPSEMIFIQNLRRHIKHVNRYSLSDELEVGVQSMLRFAKTNATTLHGIGKVYYRARINGSGRGSAPYPPDEMGAPPGEVAGPGRVNPEGIPYLYCAENEETAVAEIRPWVGSSITIATVQLKHPVTYIDLAKTVPEVYRIVWNELFGHQFTFPFEPTDRLNHTVTQFLAEKFKRAGFEGVIYKSGQVKSGINYALFEQDKYEIVATKGLKVRSVVYETV